MFKAKGKSDNWRTPQWLFDRLNAMFNFTIDAACSEDNCKVFVEPNHGTRWTQRYENGLDGRWIYERVFCNPPFSKKAAWIEKMHDEVINRGCPLCVMILPMCLDTKVFNKYINGVFHWEHLPYRVSFLDENNKPVNGNPSGTIVVYAWKQIERS